MNVNAMYIPISERGREVVRTLKEHGFDVQYKDVLGHFVCNLGLSLDSETLRAIAYDLALDRAEFEERYNAVDSRAD